MQRIIICLLVSLSLNVNAQSDRYCIQDSIVELVNNQMGVSYKWGTSNPNVSFDCSGFTSFIYQSCHIAVPRSSRLYSHKGIEITLQEAEIGDCILFTGTQNKTIGHVGIILRNDETGTYFAHCSSSKKHFGVTITRLQDSGYMKRFVSIRRLF